MYRGANQIEAADDRTARINLIKIDLCLVNGGLTDDEAPIYNFNLQSGGLVNLAMN